MIKAKWLYYELPMPLGELSQLLRRAQYDDTKAHGFTLSESNSERLSGQYIEKIETTAILTDPFGNVSEQLVTTYYTCKFNLTADSHLMCIIDPPRSLRKFIAKLHDILGLGFVLADITINPLDWAEHAAKSVGKVTVTHIASSGIKTRHDGLAKISVSSKKDSREDFYEMVSNRRHNIDTVKFTLTSEESPDAVCEMTKFATCKVKGYGYSELIQSLKACLQEVIKD